MYGSVEIYDDVRCHHGVIRANAGDGIVLSAVMRG